jgi:DNA/RNA-binding domain of Phe-tRNA-synthetase-like protein
VGLTGRSNLASSESLLRYLLKHRRLPRVNPLVDLYNLVSVETRLSMGAHDLARVAGDVTLRFTDGSEWFHPLGAAGPEPVRAGEYAYVDGSNDLICRLDVRQAEKTRLTPGTADCLFIIQGNAATEPAQLRRATEHLIKLVGEFCGGEHRVL